MAIKVLFVLLVLSIVLPIAAFYLGERKAGRFKRILAINLISFFGILILTTVFLFSGNVMAADVAAAAASPATASGLTAQGVGYFSAALVTAVGMIATGLATGKAASAALGALSENENIMGKAIIFVALCEGIAIYGLLISVMILAKI